MMTAHQQNLFDVLGQLGLQGVSDIDFDNGQVSMTASAATWLEVAVQLRDHEQTKFEQLIDACGVDYLQYGRDEWASDSTGSAGFSRGVSGGSVGRLSFGDEVEPMPDGQTRYAVVYQLLSVSLNHRLTVKCFAQDNEFPVVPSVTGVWSCADWAEREAFDLFGIHFEGHPDLRRLLTDYGFVGHPFRKDFPLVGHVEMRYDPQRKRVVYEPVSIEPRVLVPRVIRKTSRLGKPVEAGPADGENNA